MLNKTELEKNLVKRISAYDVVVKKKDSTTDQKIRQSLQQQMLKIERSIKIINDLLDGVN